MLRPSTRSRTAAFVSHILGVPEFVNRACGALFADGISAATPLIAKSEWPASPDPSPDNAPMLDGRAWACLREVSLGLSLLVYEGGSTEGLHLVLGEPARDGPLRARGRRLRLPHHRGPNFVGSGCGGSGRAPTSPCGWPRFARAAVISDRARRRPCAGPSAATTVMPRALRHGRTQRPGDLLGVRWMEELVASSDIRPVTECAVLRLTDTASAVQRSPRRVPNPQRLSTRSPRVQSLCGSCQRQARAYCHGHS